MLSEFSFAGIYLPPFFAYACLALPIYLGLRFVFARSGVLRWVCIRACSSSPFPFALFPCWCFMSERSISTQRLLRAGLTLVVVVAAGFLVSALWRAYVVAPGPAMAVSARRSCASPRGVRHRRRGLGRGRPIRQTRRGALSH
ncbi:DUF1656 domain-containing protein [Pseudomonas qingdaonensis]|nr:DUF1656 domain-containing protein [Pseudomonas qingdaonensis]